MVDGVNTCNGHHAVSHVVMDIKQDIVIVIIQFQNTEVPNVMDRVNKLVDAILENVMIAQSTHLLTCLLYTSPSPRDS